MPSLASNALSLVDSPNKTFAEPIELFYLNFVHPCVNTLYPLCNILQPSENYLLIGQGEYSFINQRWFGRGCYRPTARGATPQNQTESDKITCVFYVIEILFVTKKNK